jgi:hypothetical protein
VGKLGEAKFEADLVEAHGDEIAAVEGEFWIGASGKLKAMKLSGRFL